MKYIVIDDSQEWLDELKKELGSENISYCLCRSVEEAIQSIEENNPKVIFCDHQLTKNGEEGLEILEKIAGKVTFYSTTSLSHFDLAVEYLHRGAEAFLGKNVNSVKKVILG